LSGVYLEYNEAMEPRLVIPLFVGWIGGWIVNYLADVLPITRRFSQPTCPHCNAAYAWQDVLLFHACRSCGKRRKLRAWIVQIFLAAVSIYIWNSPPAHLGYALGLLILLYFSMDFVIDLEHRLILHPTSIFGALLGLGAGTLRQGLVSTLTGGLVGFAIMFIFYLLGTIFARIRARKMRTAGLETDNEEALGAGDVILATILGLFLGWPLTWFGLVFGILLGGAISILLVLALLISGKYKEKAWMVFIPYGPYFLLSSFMIIFFPTLVKIVVPK
jgi:leader peptidase (prepilin peptidase)/N-methyltransferase